MFAWNRDISLEKTCLFVFADTCYAHGSINRTGQAKWDCKFLLSSPRSRCHTIIFIIVQTPEQHLLRTHNFSAAWHMGSKEESCFISFHNTSLDKRMIFVSTPRFSGSLIQIRPKPKRFAHLHIHNMQIWAAITEISFFNHNLLISKDKHMIYWHHAIIISEF